MKMADKHGDLLRIAVSGPSNDHRLGGHEAPPAIVSIFLGADTQNALRHFSHGDPLNPPVTGSLGATQLPSFRPDATDRNRTSPFAYTGACLIVCCPSANLPPPLRSWHLASV